MQTQIDRSREGKIPGSGSPGSPGASLGEVRIVVRHEDMKSLKEFGTVQEAPLSQHPKREVHDTSWSAVKQTCFDTNLYCYLVFTDEYR